MKSYEQIKGTRYESDPNQQVAVWVVRFIHPAILRPAKLWGRTLDAPTLSMLSS